MLTYTSTPLHFRGNYCSKHSTTFILKHWVVTLWIHIINKKYNKLIKQINYDALYRLNNTAVYKVFEIRFILQH